VTVGEGKQKASERERASEGEEWEREEMGRLCEEGECEGELGREGKNEINTDNYLQDVAAGRQEMRLFGSDKQEIHKGLKHSI
jgi:hypothetical protein